MKGIAAGIVVYYPDMELLKKNIDAVMSQVEVLILVNNGLPNGVDIRHVAGESAVIIENETNMGIATALTQIVRFCYDNGVKWVLTLDQDSICPPNMIEEYLKYFKDESVGIISCRWTGAAIHGGWDKDVEKIDFCITSGSFTNVGICHKLNYFDEKMFIDWVDWDYCATLRENEYSILRVNTVEMFHNRGTDIKQIKLLGKKYHVLNYSPLRYYYIMRNGIYFLKKHSGEVYSRTGFIISLFKYFAMIFFEDKKVEKLHSVGRGIIDGIAWRV